MSLVKSNHPIRSSSSWSVLELSQRKQWPQSGPSLGVACCPLYYIDVVVPGQGQPDETECMGNEWQRRIVQWNFPSGLTTSKLEESNKTRGRKNWQKYVFMSRAWQKINTLRHVRHKVVTIVKKNFLSIASFSHGSNRWLSAACLPLKLG